MQLRNTRGLMVAGTNSCNFLFTGVTLIRIAFAFYENDVLVCSTVAAAMWYSMSAV